MAKGKNQTGSQQRKRDASLGRKEDRGGKNLGKTEEHSKIAKGAHTKGD